MFVAVSQYVIAVCVMLCLTRTEQLAGAGVTHNLILFHQTLAAAKSPGTHLGREKA